MSLISATFRAVYHLGTVALKRRFRARYNIRGRIQSLFRVWYTMTATVGSVFRVGYEIIEKDRVHSKFRARYTLIDFSVRIKKPAENVSISSPSLPAGDAPFISFNISNTEPGYCLSFAGQIASAGFLKYFQSGDSFSVTVGGVNYGFVVDDYSSSESFGSAGYEIKARSKTKLLDFPYAAAVKKDFLTPTKASIIASEIAGDIDVSWQIIDWVIPSRLFTARSESPLSAIRRLAQAAGGILHSSNDGETLIVRYQHSDTAAGAYQDSSILSMSGGFEKSRCFNKVALSDTGMPPEFDVPFDDLPSDEYLPATTTTTLPPEFEKIIPEDDPEDVESFLGIDIDPRRNEGRTSFKPGDRVYLRVWSTREYHLLSSWGSVQRVAKNESVSQEEVIPFIMDTRPQTRFINRRIENVDWYGFDLGEVRRAGLRGLAAEKADLNTVGVSSLLYKNKYDVWEVTSPVEESKYYIFVLSRHGDGVWTTTSTTSTSTTSSTSTSTTSTSSSSTTSTSTTSTTYTAV